MRRLYFLMPDIAATQELVKELLLSHVDEHHIHVVAKEGTPMEELPEANLFQKSDFVPAIERGLTVGAATGLICGLVAMTLPATGVIIGGGAVLFITAAGTGVGGLMSSLVGVGLPNSRLEKFEERINAGEVLVLVDVKRRRVDEIQELVRKHHPEADIQGTEPLSPPFP
ncbi:Protein of unknown function [Marinobacter antarcticus]|uniref:DUF1269 domain-containing protein n=1 Tax=Marinobacter antarcticus TaxID=564117 RepID=A0A1M6PBP2_9GAMM|nr:DUF1269 domain-containing protein [Marinobacter antarcticus]SHK05290.1 Protein of unknown function [Marinobacter antarcticus]